MSNEEKSLIEGAREQFYGDVEKYDLFHALESLLEAVEEDEEVLDEIFEEYQEAGQVYNEVLSNAREQFQKHNSSIEQELRSS